MARILELNKHAVETTGGAAFPLDSSVRIVLGNWPFVCSARGGAGNREHLERRRIRASETSKGRPDDTEYVLQSWPKVKTHCVVHHVYHVLDDVRGDSTGS